MHYNAGEDRSSTNDVFIAVACAFSVLFVVKWFYAYTMLVLMAAYKAC